MAADLCCRLAATYFAPADQDTAQAICHAESPTGAPGDGGQSRGPFQINLPSHPDLASLNLDDPDVNAQAAAQIKASSGWGPWSTYNNGAYRQYLGSCGGSSSPLASLPQASAILTAAGPWIPIGLLALIFAGAYDALS
ncbi:MAG TPA: hypothetical protein VMW62_09145 [Chloroflexota bacterium]|nr:hypothetical protein [Chloroflexota bacterium]